MKYVVTAIIVSIIFSLAYYYKPTRSMDNFKFYQTSDMVGVVLNTSNGDMKFCNANVCWVLNTVTRDKNKN
jgi:hypothetical protein